MPHQAKPHPQPNPRDDQPRATLELTEYQVQAMLSFCHDAIDHGAVSSEMLDCAMGVQIMLEKASEDLAVARRRLAAASARQRAEHDSQ